MRTGFTPEQIENIMNRFKRYGCDAGSLGHQDVLMVIEQLRVENERLAPSLCDDCMKGNHRFHDATLKLCMATISHVCRCKERPHG